MYRLPIRPARLDQQRPLRMPSSSVEIARENTDERCVDIAREAVGKNTPA
jgi:hypothetical protein